MGMATRRFFTAFIEARSCRIMGSAKMIADAVARAGVERDELIEGRRAGWDVGQVRDSADVEEHPVPCRMAEENVVRKGHQRRPLPAGRAVGSSEIAYHVASGFGGDQGGVQPLDGVGWVVEEGLAVGGDGG